MEAAGSADAPASLVGGGLACESSPGELAEAGACSGSAGLAFVFWGAYSDDPGNWVSVTNWSRIRRWAGVSDLRSKPNPTSQSQVISRDVKLYQLKANAYLGMVTLNLTIKSPLSFL